MPVCACCVLFWRVFLQFVLGTPVNMVHGNLVFGLLYELGVATFGLAWLVVRALTETACKGAHATHIEALLLLLLLLLLPPPPPLLPLLPLLSWALLCQSRCCVSLTLTPPKQMDGGVGSVTGCSGGLFTVLGLHLAELLISWPDLRGSRDHPQVLDRRLRLAGLLAVVAVDALL